MSPRTKGALNFVLTIACTTAIAYGVSRPKAVPTCHRVGTDIHFPQDSGGGSGGSGVTGVARPIFNVLDFGGVGNGTANDTTAVQATLTAAAAAGGEAFLPAGTWRVEPGVLAITNAFGVELDGVGVDATLLDVDDTLGNSGAVGYAITNCQGWGIHGLTITSPTQRSASSWQVRVIGGNGTGTRASAPTIASTITATDGLIERVNFNNSGGAVDQTDADGGYPGGAWIIVIENVFVYNPATGATIFHVYTWGGNQDFRNVWISGVSTLDTAASGLTIEGSGGFSLYKFDTLFCDTGLLVDGNPGKFGRVQAGQISSCYFDSGNLSNVIIKAEIGANVGNITFTNDWFATNHPGGGGLLVIGDGITNVDDIQVIGSRFVASRSIGLLVNRATNVLLSGDFISGAATTGVTILNASDVGLSNVKVGTYNLGSTTTPVGLTVDGTSTISMDDSSNFGACTATYVSDPKWQRPFVSRTAKVAGYGTPTLTNRAFYTPCVNLSDITVVSGSVTAVSSNGGWYQVTGASGTYGTGRFPASTTLVTNVRTQKWSIGAHAKITVPAPSPAGSIIRVTNMTDGSTADCYLGMVGASSTTNWAAQCGATVVVTSVAVDSNEHDVQERADGTNVKFYIDETLVATIAQSNAANAAGFAQIAAGTQGAGPATFLIGDWAAYTE